MSKKNNRHKLSVNSEIGMVKIEVKTELDSDPEEPVVAAGAIRPVQFNAAVGGRRRAATSTVTLQEHLVDSTSDAEGSSPIKLPKPIAASSLTGHAIGSDSVMPSSVEARNRINAKRPTRNLHGIEIKTEPNEEPQQVAQGIMKPTETPLSPEVQQSIDTLNSEFEKFLLSDEMQQNISRLAEERVRINYLMQCYNLEPIHFEMGMSFDEMERQIEDRIRNRNQ